MSTIADKSVSLLTIISREGWFTTRFWLRASRGAGQLSLSAQPAALDVTLLCPASGGHLRTMASAAGRMRASSWKHTSRARRFAVSIPSPFNQPPPATLVLRHRLGVGLGRMLDPPGKDTSFVGAKALSLLPPFNQSLPVAHQHRATCLRRRITVFNGRQTCEHTGCYTVGRTHPAKNLKLNTAASGIEFLA